MRHPDFTTHSNPNSHILAETTVAIRHFWQLRELQLETTSSDHIFKPLLSSITSTELRKITILARHIANWRWFLRWTELWLDKQLCEVVDRLRATGHRHTLEVELRFINLKCDLSEMCFTELLSEFREKGAVTVMDFTCGYVRVLHSSTHNH